VNRAAKVAVGSVVLGLVVLALKYAAYRLTGSVALYSDALETVINVVAAAAAVWALRVSAKPADREHPYGHHKAEYFSAVLEGVLIVLAALSILRAAWLDYRDPRPLDLSPLGLGANALATVLNAAWAWWLMRLGRRWRSPALAADGRHLLADVVTSTALLAGVLLVLLTGQLALDPALAAAAALYILWSGWDLTRESVGGLMDEAASPEVLARIRALISAEAEGALEAHDLRTRNAGRVTFVDFHLVVPGDMRVAEAHEICDRVEAALKREVEDAVIVIHVEPEHKAKHQGVVVL
jgi:cation diffusion facilitator family transporter